MRQSDVSTQLGGVEKYSGASRLDARQHVETLPSRYSWRLKLQIAKLALSTCYAKLRCSSISIHFYNLSVLIPPHTQAQCSNAAPAGFCLPSPANPPSCAATAQQPTTQCPQTTPIPKSQRINSPSLNQMRSLHPRQALTMER